MKDCSFEIILTPLNLVQPSILYRNLIPTQPQGLFLLHSVDSARLLRTLQQRPTEFSAALDSTSNFCCFAKVFVQPEAFFAALTRLVGSLGLEFVWLRSAKPLTLTRVYPLRLGRVQSACVGRARRRLFFAGQEAIKPLAIAGSLLSPNW